MTILKSEAELEAFLERHQWCEDCYITHIDPFPPTAGCERVTVELKYISDGRFTPGSVTTYRAVRFEFVDVLDVSLYPDAVLDPDNCAQGVDLCDSEHGGLRLWFEVPAELYIEARTIEAEELPNIEELVVPTLSEREISAYLTGRPPGADWWTAEFAREGHIVLWHMIEGDLRPTVDGAYDGWFLQTQADYASGRQGLFFRLSTDKDGQHSITLDNDGLAPDVWEATKRIVGLLGCRSVHCGNCIFTTEQWLGVIGANERPHN